MDERSEMNLTELFSIISRRGTIFFSLFVIVVVAAISVTFFIPPVYQARAKMIIQNENNLYPSGLLPTTAEDSVFLRTQKEIITSRFIVAQALKSVKTKKILSMLDYESLRKKISAEYLGDSNVLEIQVSLQSPQEAVELANGLMAVFMEYHKSSKIELLNKNLDAISRETERLKKSADDLSVRMRELKSKDQLNFYQAQIPYYTNNILDLYKRNLLTESDIERFKAELTKTQEAVNRQGGEFFYPALANAASSNAGLTPTSSLSTIPWMENIKKNISDAQSKLAQLNLKYTEDYPEVIGVENQIALLKSNLDDELQKVVRAYSDYYAGTIRFLEMQQKSGESEKMRNVAELEKLSRDIDKASIAQIEYTMASKFHTILEDIYAVFLRKQNELTLLMQQFSRTDLPNIRIFESAALPLKVVSPILALNLVLGICFGIIFGICGAMIEERKNAAKSKAAHARNLPPDKRCMRRVDKSSLVSYAKTYATSANISGSGLCLTLSENMALNTRLPLKIKVADEDFVHATGKLIWNKPSAVKNAFHAGFYFEEIDSHEREKLLKFLYNGS